MELTRRRGLRFVLIDSDRIELQLRQLARELALGSQEAFSRCAVCNVLLEPGTRDAVRDLVPPYVFQTQVDFRRCPECGRVYWRGTHWARMVAQMEDTLGGPT